VTRRPWSKEEKHAVARHLLSYFKTNRVPGKDKCEACISREPVLQRRHWKNVKYFIKNALRKKDPLDFLSDLHSD